jgi:Flp pilus assembly protein TadD, contains TPR repeats
MSTTVGVLVALGILLLATGATVFFLTRSPDNERFISKGRTELSRGQYAFAVDTLNKAAAATPNDPRVYLLLARAYVGINDVEKAWASISKAQQLGEGVVAEPDLASDLANYYMKKKDYDKAIDLLRPLAKGNIEGKKQELADLDAAYGDELLSKGDLGKALRCWEEVRDLRAGSRFGEAEARLSTIYEKYATKLSGEEKDDEAIAYYGKLTALAQNPKYYLALADIYERKKQLEMAIDQMRKAIKMSNSPELQHRLSGLLARRGKELLDQGDDTVGYAYLQQAKSVDPSSASVPDVTLKNIDIGIDTSTRMPRIAGEVWNPMDKSIGTLNLKAELYDTENSISLWSKEQRIVDEFMKPLGSHEAQPFHFTAGSSAKFDGTVEFRMYVDGSLYKAYKLEKGGKSKSSVADGGDSRSSTKASSEPPTAPQRSIPVAPPPDPAQTPSRATSTVPGGAAPTPGVPTTAPPTAPPPGKSVEEQTLKDLDF